MLMPGHHVLAVYLVRRCGGWQDRQGGPITRMMRRMEIATGCCPITKYVRRVDNTPADKISKWPAQTGATKREPAGKGTGLDFLDGTFHLI